MKDRIIRNIKIFFEKEDDYYKLIRISNFWNYIKYESSGNRNKNLSVKEYLDEVKPYQKDAIICLQKSGTWRVQLTIVINFVFF